MRWVIPQNRQNDFFTRKNLSVLKKFETMLLHLPQSTSLYKAEICSETGGGKIIVAKDFVYSRPATMRGGGGARLAMRWRTSHE